MTDRQQYEIYVQCPKCGKHGRTVWEEDESAIYGRGANSKLNSISAGFSSDKKSPPKILCDGCGVPVGV